MRLLRQLIQTHLLFTHLLHRPMLLPQHLTQLHHQLIPLFPQLTDHPLHFTNQLRHLHPTHLRLLQLMGQRHQRITLLLLPTRLPHRRIRPYHQVIRILLHHIRLLHQNMDPFLRPIYLMHQYMRLLHHRMDHLCRTMKLMHQDMDLRLPMQ